MRGVLALTIGLSVGCGAAVSETRTTRAEPTPATTTATPWVDEDDALAIAPEATAEHGATRELVPQWGHTAAIRELRWLPSGPLAVLDDVGHLALLEPSSGERLLWERPAPRGPWEHGFEVDASGRYLRAGDHVHDLATGDERPLGPDLPRSALAAASPDLASIAWTVPSDDGAHLYVADGAGDVRLDTAFESGWPIGVVWSPTARSILVAMNAALSLVSATDGRVLFRVEAGAEGWDDGLSYAFRPTGGALAVLTGGELRLIAPRDGRELARVSGVVPPSTWATVRWSADGARLAVARRDEEHEQAVVVVFDAHDGSRVGEILVPFGLPSEVGLSPDARIVAVATSDGRIHLHEAEGGAEVLIVDSGIRGTVRPYAFDPRSRFLAVAGDEAIIVWDLELREEVSGFWPSGAERHVGGMRGLGGSLGIVATDDEASYLWTPTSFRMDDACPYGGTVRVDDGGVVRVIAADAVCDLSHGITVRPGWWIRSSTSDGHLVVNANGGVFVEDATNGERRATLALDDGERPPCSTSACGLPVAISDDGAYVAMARRTLLRVYDGRTGRELARTEVDARTAVLQFAPDGRTLAFASEAGAHVLFEIPRLGRRTEWTGHGTADAFSPDGRTHVGTREAALVVTPLRGRRTTSTEVAIEAGTVVDGIRFVEGGERFVVVGHREDGESRREVLELRTSATGALLATATGDAIGVSAGGRSLARCEEGLLELVAIGADGRVGEARAAGSCMHDAQLDVTDDGRFVYVDDDEGLRIVRTADAAHLQLHLVDAGWEVTAAIVRDDRSRWDDGGYFDVPFLLRGAGPITLASLDDATSSRVDGLAGYFARAEEPPHDEVAQPDETAASE